jgi:hypothetical protein
MAARYNKIVGAVGASLFFGGTTWLGLLIYSRKNYPEVARYEFPTVGSAPHGAFLFSFTIDFWCANRTQLLSAAAKLRMLKGYTVVTSP